jgi:hypothetical protein
VLPGFSARPHYIASVRGARETYSTARRVTRAESEGKDLVRKRTNARRINRVSARFVPWPRLPLRLVRRTPVPYRRYGRLVFSGWLAPNFEEVIHLKSISRHRAPFKTYQGVPDSGRRLYGLCRQANKDRFLQDRWPISGRDGNLAQISTRCAGRRLTHLASPPNRALSRC